MTFWHLYLAHLLGDYPLQTDWLAQRKRTWWGLLWHMTVHLVILLALAGVARSSLWPFLVALILAHLAIDVGKNWLSSRRPHWFIWPYLIDQIMHFFSIVLVTFWIEQSAGVTATWLSPTAAVYLIGYVLVTHVWFVTERLLAYTDEAYQREVSRKQWPRMLTRAAMLSGLLLGWRYLWPVALLFQLPYRLDNYGRRALLTDLGVALFVLVFIVLATRSIGL